MSLAFSAMSGLLVISIPPSPALMCFHWLKENTPQSPIVPTYLSPHFAPIAWEQSSITFLCNSGIVAFAKCMIYPMWQGEPWRWTAIIALVFLVRAMAVGSIFRVPSMSENTGSAPHILIQEADAEKV